MPSKVFQQKPLCGQTEGLSAGQLAPVRPQWVVFVLAAQKERTKTPRADLSHKSSPQTLSCAAALAPSFVQVIQSEGVLGSQLRLWQAEEGKCWWWKGI